MCRLIKVIHFGCEEQHTEQILIRCRPALEYMLDMPFKDVCKRMVGTQSWVMSPCRFCTEYKEARKLATATTSHRRSMSLQENELPHSDKASTMRAASRDDSSVPGAKRSFEEAFHSGEFNQPAECKLQASTEISIRAVSFNKQV